MNKLIAALVFAGSLLESSPVWAAEQTVTLSVSGMTCPSCPYMVRQTLVSVDGVLDVKVSFSEGIAKVTYDDAQCSVADLTAATGNVGFPSEQIEQGS